MKLRFVLVFLTALLTMGCHHISYNPKTGVFNRTTFLTDNSVQGVTILLPDGTAVEIGSSKSEAKDEVLKELVRRIPVMVP